MRVKNVGCLSRSSSGIICGSETPFGSDRNRFDERMRHRHNLSLIEDDVLVQNIHSGQATARSHVSPFRANNCLPSCSFCAAARLTRPCRKVSSGRSARCSNTCDHDPYTPLKSVAVGLDLWVGDDILSSSTRRGALRFIHHHHALAQRHCKSPSRLLTYRPPENPRAQPNRTPAD
jgi:hypothetical protein